MDVTERPSDPSTALPPPNPIELKIAEYKALRNEVIEHMERNGQILALTVLALGTLMAAGVQFHSAPLVLVYPILAIVLANMWSTEDDAIEEIGAFIRDEIENHFTAPQYRFWEDFLRTKTGLKGRFRSTLLYLYVLTELVSLFLASYLSSDIQQALIGLWAGNFSIPRLSSDTFFFAVDLLIVAISLLFLVARIAVARLHRRQARSA